MLPSLLTQTIIAFQDSTIASIIGVSDVFQMTNVISAREQRPIELYSLLAVMFLVICFTLSRLVRRIDARISRRINGVRAAVAGPRGGLLGFFAPGMARQQ
jgi:glutamate/aspartate transport system permease protein